MSDSDSANRATIMATVIMTAVVILTAIVNAIAQL